MLNVQCVIVITVDILSALLHLPVSIISDILFRMVMFNIPSVLLTNVAMAIVGLIIFSYFSLCDPLTHPDPNLRISSPNQVYKTTFYI